MAEPIRVIILKDDGVYVAQCLEIDIAAQGATPEEAMKRLEIAFRAEQKDAAEAGVKLEDLGPAPEAFRAVYDSEVIDRTLLVA